MAVLSGKDTTFKGYISSPSVSTGNPGAIRDKGGYPSYSTGVSHSAEEYLEHLREDIPGTDRIEERHGRAELLRIYLAAHDHIYVISPMREDRRCDLP